MKKFFTYADPVVPVHIPRLVLETAVEQGAARRAVLDGVGLPPGALESPDARISYLQFGRLVHNAVTATGNPALGLDVGWRIRVPHLGLLGLVVASSATVGTALEATLRYCRALSPSFELGLRVAAGRATLVVDETISMAPLREFATEALITGFDTQGERLAGHPIPVLEMRFAYPRPPYAERYRERHAVPTHFDQPRTEIDFDASVLAAPIADADPATAKLAEQYCARLVPSVVPTDGLVAQVRRMLGASEGRPPALDSLARSLQTSERSLRRFLRSMGTSYLELLDESRRQRAEEWVRSTDMTCEQMAEQLGFSNVRSFRRAFKRWTGHPPSELRSSDSAAE